MGIIISLFTGALSGWLAGKLMNSKHGLIFNIILGLLGGLVGGWVLGLVGIAATSWLDSVIVGVVGACILIFISRKI